MSLATGWWWIAGLAAMVAGAVILVLDIPAWNTLWFLFAWLGWLVVLDGWIARRGPSFLAGRRRELGVMALWSVPYWCLFEAYNLRLENWYYVFLPHSEWAQAAFAFIAFATVLPACFFHAEVLRVYGWFEEVRMRPLTIGPGLEWAIGLFGVACLVFPLLWPRTCFWMVWGATFGLPALVNRRVGAPSLLRDLEQGRPGRWLRLLAGGLLAGGMWEGMNYWARAKWIYTVPGLEDLKLFEMPLLGFIGFPVLAIEAFAAYSFLCWLTRAGRHWEWPDADQPGPILRRHQVATMACIVLFSVGTSVWTLDPAVQARRPLLEELEGLNRDHVLALRAAGLKTPEQLVRAAGDGEVLEVGVAPDVWKRVVQQAEFSLHKGMGADAGALLLAAGVDSMGQLATSDPAVLHGSLVDLAKKRSVVSPRLNQVRVWVRAAPWGPKR